MLGDVEALWHTLANMLPILVGLGSALCAALAHRLGPKATAGRAAEELEAINFAIMGVMLAVVLAAVPDLYQLRLSAAGVGLLALVVAIDSAGNYFLFKTYRQSHPTVATPLLSLAPAFAFPISWLAPLPHEDGGLTIVLGYGATLLVVLVAMDWKNLRHFQQVTFFPAILSSLCFGLSAVPTRYLLREWHEINAPTLYMVRAFLIAAVGVALWRGRALPRLPLTQLRMISLRGVFVILQYLLLYKALTLNSVGVALTLANVTPALVLLGGVLFLGETWSWKRVVPSLLAIAAAILMR